MKRGAKMNDPENKEIWANIGKRLRIARQGASMSQRDAARIMGYSAQTISLIEHGRIRSDGARLLRFAKAYDFPIAFFFNPGEPPKLTLAPWGLFKRQKAR